jgi:hypothetical protein
MRYVLLFLALAFAACKKDGDVDTKTMLTGNSWRLSGLLLESPPGTAPVDITLGTYKLCELDDIMLFEAGGTYRCSEGTGICFPANNSTFYELRDGSWSLSKSDSLLTIQKGFSQLAMYFKVKSSNYLELYRDETNYLNEVVRYTYIFEGRN